MQITPPKVRLLLDAPQPLQTAGPQPGGCALDRPGLEIDRRPQVSADRYGETLVITMQPQLSLLGSQRNREEVRLASINLIDEMIAAHFVDRPEAGIERANATQPRRHCIESSGSRRGNTWRAAE